MDGWTGERASKRTTGMNEWITVLQQIIFILVSYVITPQNLISGENYHTEGIGKRPVLPLFADI